MSDIKKMKRAKISAKNLGNLYHNQNLEKAVGVVFPSSPCDQKEIAAIKKLFEEKALLCSLTGKFFLEEKTSLIDKKTNEFLLIKALDRFSQLKAAICDPQIKIIWCARGGYGSADLLPFLYQMPKPKNPKLIIGFSDISAIATFFIQEWNWSVLCAPMLYGLAFERVSKKSQKIICDLVEKKTANLKYELKLLSHGYNCDLVNNTEISGKIVGGCLSVISSSFGTRNHLDFGDKILFLEDIDEKGERLDRYFNQIARLIELGSNLMGSRSKSALPKAILLGNFWQGISKRSIFGRNIETAILRFILAIDKKIPVFLEAKGYLGHSSQMRPLLLGSEAKIVKNSQNNWQLLQKVDLKRFD